MQPAPAAPPAARAAQPQPVEIPSAHGPLAGLFFAAGAAPKDAVLLHPATGVPRDYYIPFAQWLAQERGLPTLIYSYRGEGASPAELRRSGLTMTSWLVEDQSAALDWLAGRFPQAGIVVVGHSLGGMGLNHHGQSDRVTRMITIATGPANHFQHPAVHLPKIAFFWWLAGPPLTAALGYLPGKALGMGADLPPGVYWQWRRWCTSRAFHGADPALRDVDRTRWRGRIRAVAMADDWMIPPETVRRIGVLYPKAQIENVTLDPKALGLGEVGHLGFFRRRNAAAWDAALA